MFSCKGHKRILLRSRCGGSRYSIFYVALKHSVQQFNTRLIKCIYQCSVIGYLVLYLFTLHCIMVLHNQLDQDPRTFSLRCQTGLILDSMSYLVPVIFVCTIGFLICNCTDHFELP